jgi:histidinol phosphatase-like enzyme
MGGRLADLMPALERTLDSGKRRVVLDNTYGSRSSRSVVVETAWQHGAPVRCVWLTTSLEDAQRNAVERMVERYGRVLGPDEMKSAAKTDPGTFPPMVQFRHQRELEPPDLSEGFTRVDEVPFERGHEPARNGRAVLFWYDGVLRTSRSGARSPKDPDDVLILPGRRELLQRIRDEGLPLLGLSWQPELAANKTSQAQVEAVFARTHELLGVTLEALVCPHPEGPPICWCRKPLPGLAVTFLARHRLDPAQCLYVGHDASDLTLARRIGFQYSDAKDFFSTPKPPA